MNQNIYDNNSFFAEYKETREKETSYNNLLEQPAMKLLLPDLKGKRILDIGCGAGYNCKQFIEKGAAFCLGIDISNKMLSLAESMNFNKNIEYKNLAIQDLSTIKDKIGATREDLFKNIAFEFINQKQENINYANDISELPYIFKDTIKFDRKIDPKKLQFGSKIDSTENEAINTYSVKEILSPEKLLLNNDLSVKLIGVKANKDKTDDAMKFLQAKLKNQRVFMRFDLLKYDQENNLLCYLYLKNKTFINAHLIKNQLVDVDNDSDYKYKRKFLNLIK